jgi:hypothetical protein
VEKLRELVMAVKDEVQQFVKTALAIAIDLNKALAVFLKNLLTVMDRGVVFDLIEKIEREPVSSDLSLRVEFKFQFMRIVCESEDYVALNLPTTSHFESPNKLLDELSRKHFLAGLLLRLLNAHLSHREKSVRLTAISTVKAIMNKHDVEKEIQEPEVKAKIAAMYLPVLSIVIDHLKTVRESDIDEKREILVCFLWVLRNIAPAVLCKWWRKETQARLVLFIEVLMQCTEAFEVGLFVVVFFFLSVRVFL